MGDAVTVPLELRTYGARIHLAGSACGVLGKKSFVAEELLLAAQGISLICVSFPGHCPKTTKKQGNSYSMVYIRKNCKEYFFAAIFLKIFFGERTAKKYFSSLYIAFFIFLWYNQRI
jgi:hypothetical protein